MDTPEAIIVNEMHALAAAKGGKCLSTTSRNSLEQSLSENEYSYYLCFSVSKRFNNLNPL